MNQKNQNSFAPATYHTSEDHTQKMGWHALAELYDGFPTKMCDRFELIATLYDDGVCSDEVTEEVQEHLIECSDCQKSIDEYRSISEMFADRRSIEVEISESDIRHSFETFTQQYGEELFSNHVSDSSNESMRLSTETTSKPAMQVEFRPKKRKLRIGAALGIVAAAAMLFAYGPALIETSVNERQFPDQAVESIVETPSQNLDYAFELLPFAKQQGHEFTKTLNEGPLKLESIHSRAQELGPLGAEYTLLYKGIPLKVELTMIQLTPAQKMAFSKRLKTEGEVLKVTRQNQKYNEHIKQTMLGQITQIEYSSNNHHIQWTASGDEAQVILQRLARLHLSH